MKKLVKIFTVVLVVAAINIASSKADEANKNKLAQAIASINTNDLIRKTYKEKVTSVLKENKNYCLTKEAEKELEKDGPEYTKIVEQFKKDEAEFYKQNFTEAELDGIHKFYSSDLGKKYINKQVDLQAKIKTNKEYMAYIGKHNEVMSKYYNKDGTCKNTNQLLPTSN